jgi:SAM-dependent methyltransferase
MDEKAAKEFNSRRQHAFDKIKWSIPPEARKGRFLDIGCGTGNGLVAAIQHGFTSAIGVDRSFDEFPWFDAKQFDALCRMHDIDPAAVHLVEADIFKIGLTSKSFDCVLMLDSIEHVPNPKSFIDIAASFVAPGGYLIIDTSPLYYGAPGAHLWSNFDPAQYPWVHLRRDFPQLVQEKNVTSWSMQRFEELNKATHSEIRDYVVQTGLAIVFEHRDQASEADIKLLAQHRHALNLDGVPDGALFEVWLQIVAQRL